MCRKILMHVAVGEPCAKEGQTFAAYIDKLDDGGHNRSHVVSSFGPQIDGRRRRTRG